MVNGGMRAARSSSNLLSTPNGSSGSIAAPASVANMIQITPPVQSLLQPLSLQVLALQLTRLHYSRKSSMNRVINRLPIFSP